MHLRARIDTVMTYIGINMFSNGVNLFIVFIIVIV